MVTLTERLEARKIIERAKGRLMTDHGMSEPAAFRWLQRTAMDRRLTMRELAERLLTERSEEPGEGQPGLRK